MINKDLQERMDALKQTGARRVLVEYFKALLDERTQALLSCNKETFERQQGRALELQEQIKYLEKGV